MTSLSKKPVAKKRGRPLGSKNNRVRKIAGKEYTFKEKAFKPTDSHQVLLENLIKELVEQIRSQKAIISYLETKLEIK
jgi:hypothetical protein